MNRYLLTSLFAILFYSTGITQPNSPVLIEPPNGASCNQTPETGWCDCGNSLNGGGNGDVLTTYEIQISDDGHFNNGHIVLDVPNYLLTHLRVPDGTLDINTRYYWRVRMTNSLGTSSWSDAWSFITNANGGFGSPILTGEEMESFVLNQNYPNPFNPSTSITYRIPQDNPVKLVVYDISGRNIATLVDGYQLKGTYSLTWNATELSSGVYFYKLESGSYSDIKRMFLVK